MNPNQDSANKTYNINTNGTVILPGKFVLIALVVGTKGGSGNTAKIYDSNATIGANVEESKGSLDTVNVFGRIAYGIPMFNGIYIVVGGGTAPDITVIYAELP